MAKINPTEVQKYLRGLKYPVHKEALISHAKERGADEILIAAFTDMPEEEFASPVAVNKALQGTKAKPGPQTA